MKLAMLVVLGLSMATPAAAQRRQNLPKIETVRPEVHMDLGWYGGFGVGARVDIPVIPDGVLRSHIDEMSISPGADLLFLYFGNRRNDVVFFPHVAWQWTFYLSESWSIGPELGMGLWFGNHAHHYRRYDYYYQRGSYVWLDPWGAFAARYHFTERNALLMRIGWPIGAQIGITF